MFILRQYIFSFISDAETLFRAEELWRDAHIVIGDVIRWAVDYEQYQEELRARRLRELSAKLVTNFDEEKLIELLHQELPLLRIKSCYLFFYDDPENPLEQATLRFAYNRQGRFAPEHEQQTFPACRIPPDGLTLSDKRYTLGVMPLYFRKEQLGFALLEIGAGDVQIFEILRTQISSALHGALLAKQLQDRTTQLSRANAEIQVLKRKT